MKIVDWEKTSTNIKNRLSGVVRSKTFAEVFNLTPEAVYPHLRGKRINVDELFAFATFLNCSIEDLLVFQDEEFVAPFAQKVSTRETVQYASSEEVTRAITAFSDWFTNCGIRNLQELFLYLPLIDPQLLKDVCFRCYGNLTNKDRFYFFNQLNYLYESIENNPAKKYADQYRNEVLRVKGEADSCFEANSTGEHWYFQTLLLFSERLTNQEYISAITNFPEEERQL